MNIHEKLIEDLQKRKGIHLDRHLRDTSSLIDFCSNDYLGFASFSLTNTDSRDSVLPPTGSTASRLLRGQNHWFEKLERKALEFHRSEAALICNSGYIANLSIFSSVPQKGDTVLYDAHCHASIRDGLRLSAARAYGFQHNDNSDLKRLIASHGKGQIFVVVEGMYSMDGTVPDLIELTGICQEHEANLIVDEAHSAGVYGPQGRGVVVDAGVEDRVFARIVTYGKAFGSFGAAILTDSVTREYLINFARPFIYSTALPPAVLVTVDNAYSLLERSAGFQEELQQKVSLFRECCGVRTNERLSFAHGPIQAVHAPGNAYCREIASQMQSLGYDIRAILSPTIAAGEERLRITLHRHNSDDEIRRMADCLERVHVKMEREKEIHV